MLDLNAPVVAKVVQAGAVGALFEQIEWAVMIYNSNLYIIQKGRGDGGSKSGRVMLLWKCMVGREATGSDACTDGRRRRRQETSKMVKQKGSDNMKYRSIQWYTPSQQT
jgi:hypothetical protein